MTKLVTFEDWLANYAFWNITVESIRRSVPAQHRSRGSWMMDLISCFR